MSVPSTKFFEALRTVQEGLAEPENRALLEEGWYRPDPRIADYLKELQSYYRRKKRDQKDRQAAGHLLEKIAYLAMNGLKGADPPMSFQSAGPQYDLLATGDNDIWRATCEAFYMDFGVKRSILVEAKAWNKPIGDAEMARLCSIMDHHLATAGLGVFLTLRGASGFPRGSKAMRSLRDAKLRQVLFYQKTQVPIVVLDVDDVLTLDQPGSLSKLLPRKIRAIGELCLNDQPLGNPPEKMGGLPRHLEGLN